MNWTDQCMRNFNIRQKLFVLPCTNIDKAEIFCVLHDKFPLPTRRRSDRETRHHKPRIFKTRCLTDFSIFDDDSEKIEIRLSFCRSFSIFWYISEGLYTKCFY